MKLTVALLVINLAARQITIAQIPPTFQIQHYTTENGLPSNGIKGIEWDEETGFLWIATEAGIARFNGIDFRIFSSQVTPFITTERISFMTRNNLGAIYAVDLNGNILKVRQNNLLFLRSTPRFTGPYNPYLYGLIVSDNFLNHKIDHPGMFLHTIPQAYALAKAVGSPSVKVLFDFYHVQIQEGNVLPTLDYAWDEIAYIQVGDTPGRNEPTTGEINYPNVLQHVYDKGYRGFVGLEHGTSKPGKEGELATLAAYRAVDPK